MKRFVILLVLVIFAFSASVALAAGKQWFIIKDKKGVCRVIEAAAKTPKTIAGPFKTKDEAQKAKAKTCAKPASKKK
ncbi:MAG: hypothetical protein P8182_03060 [Deltaproteobacteria bacterium]